MKRRVTATMLIVAGTAVVQACGDDDATSSIPDRDGGALDGGADRAAPPIDGGRGDVSAPRIDAGFDAGHDAGPVTTLDGGACDGGALSLDSVTPEFGSIGATTAVTITGSGFVSLPRVALVSSAGVVTPATNAAFVSGTSVTATIPAGLPTGTYDIAVVNPGECAGRLAGKFKVVANPAPLVLSVAPAQGTTQSDVDVSITGCYLPANATVQTLDATGALVTHAVKVAPAEGVADPRCNGQPLATMSATIETKTKALTAGAYVLRVGNPTDATFGDYSTFVVSNPSGNLTGNWTAGPSLAAGRRSLGLVAARLDDAHRFLYAVGGEDAAGAPLASVEVAAVDRFGQLGAWATEKSALTTPRSGVAVVQRGLYLYAIGGTSSNDGTRGANTASPSGTALATVERAKLLEASGAPTLTSATASTAAGALARGAYYYRVAAMLGAADPATEGETLASEELVASLSAAGQVTLTWAAPAVGTVARYRVYRTAAADGVSGAEVLLADDVTGTTFTDDGSKTTAANTPRALGATGPWVPTSALVHARLNATATIAADPLGNWHVFVLGGWGQCGATPAAEMSCYEHASISDDGKTLGAWVAGLTTMTRSRMGLGADALDGFIVVAGGKGVNGPGNTVEYAPVTAGGSLGAFTNAGGFSGERDGTRLLAANGYAYTLFGGSAPNYSQTADQSAKAVTTATTLTFPNWNNAGANFATKLGRHGAAAESAYFYVAGGTTNDTDALSTVFQILH